MTYERSRDSREDAANDVVIKKSTLTMLTVAILVLLAVIFVMVWQDYEQNTRENDLSNHQNLTTTRDTSQSPSST